jgi:hypothetical protein
MGQGEFFLGFSPKEWRVLAGPSLQRLIKGGDGFLQPGRPLLALAEPNCGEAMSNPWDSVVAHFPE